MDEKLHMWKLVIFLLSIAALGVAATSVCRASQAQVPATSPGPYPIRKPSSGVPLTGGHQSCNRIEFTVGVDGKPRDFSVWAHYLLPGQGYNVSEDWLSSNKLDRFTMQTLSRWRFRPRMENGHPISTARVIFNTFYTTNVFSMTAFDTMRWLCTLPPMHGVPIVAASDEGAAASATAIAAFNAWNGKGIDLGPAHVNLDPTLLPQNARPETVWLQFCVDTAGRASDVTVVGPKPDPDFVPAARHVLEQVNFPVRKFRGKTMLSCGLRVRVRFDDVKRRPGDVIGLVGPIVIGTLTTASPEPKLEEEKPVKLSLSIVPGTKLPPVATVKLRFCIETDGSVTHAAVVHADPPGLFDRAAIATVEGWRFEPPRSRMCDVYEGVRFPLASH